MQRTAKLGGDSPELQPFTFPKSLVNAPPTQLEQSAQHLGARFQELENRITRLASAMGVTMTHYFTDQHDPAQRTGPDVTSVLLMVLLAAATDEERIEIKRRRGEWGLYYVIICRASGATEVRLRDAPLETRLRFLLESEKIIEKYLHLCKERLSPSQKAVEVADRALSRLDAMVLTDD